MAGTQQSVGGTRVCVELHAVTGVDSLVRGRVVKRVGCAKLGV